MGCVVHTEMDHQRFADEVTNGHRRVQRTNGILEHHLYGSAIGARRLATELGHLEISKSNRTRGRFDEPHDGPANGGLARSGLANEA